MKREREEEKKGAAHLFGAQVQISLLAKKCITQFHKRLSEQLTSAMNYVNNERPE